MGRIGQTLAVVWLISRTASGQEPPDAWDWAGAVQDDAWAKLKVSVSGFVPASPDEWSVTVIAGDGWGRTGEFRLWKPFRGAASVAYVRTVGDNLLGQLHALREKTPDLAVESAISVLDVRKGGLAADQCPGLTSLATRFQNIRIPVLPEGYLALHAPGYSVTVSPANRGERQYSVDANENDLARWCARLQETVQRCERAR